jgi:hypothetical protein
MVSAHFIRDVHGEIAGGLERDRQSRPEADIFTDTLMSSIERFLRDPHQKDRDYRVAMISKFFR